MPQRRSQLPLNLPNPHTEYSGLINFIEGPARRRVLENTGKWTCLEFNKAKNNSTATLRFMVNPQGEAMGHITRHPDKTITEHCADPGNCSQDLLHQRSWMQSKLQRLIRAELLRAATLDWEPLKAATIIADPEKARHIHNALDRTALDIAETASSLAKMPRGTRTIKYDDFSKIANRIIKEQILDPSITRLIAHGFHNTPPSQELHNRFAQNAENIDGLTRFLTEYPHTFQTAARLTDPSIFQTASASQLETALMDLLAIPQEQRTLARAMCEYADWSRDSKPHRLRLLVDTAHKLPPETNTHNVQLALAGESYHIEKILNLPGEALEEWHKLLHLLSTAPELGPNRLSRILSDTSWGLILPYGDSSPSDWKSPKDHRELAERHKLTSPLTASP